MNYRLVGDPETHTRIQQYELAFRMQASVPELTDLASGARSHLQPLRRRRRRSRAPSPTRPCWPGGWSSAACASCRSTTTTGTRTRNVAGRLPDQCRDVDQACYGLIQDLKQRGLLDETLVIWGGEFGRTIYSQGGLTPAELRPRPSPALLHHVDGRRRHAGRGTIYGETDDFSYNIVKDPVHVHDFHATVLHLLGLRPRAVHVSSIRGSTRG